MKNTNKITGMRKITAMLSIVTLVVLGIGLSACKKKDEAGGPMEELGKKMDEKIGQVSKKVDEQADKVEKKMGEIGKELGKNAEKAKRKVADGADKVSEKLRDESKDK